MKQLKQILSALLILPFLIFSAACNNSAADSSADISASQTEVSVTDLQTVSQTEPPVTSSPEVSQTSAQETTETSADTSAPTAITYKMTAEDEEVKKIIEGIYDDADNFINHVASPYEYIDYEAMGIENPESGISGSKDEFLFYTDKNDYDSENEIECFSYVPLSIPGISSCEDLKNRMLTCFTEEVTNDWLRIRTTKCELLEKNGKSFLVKLTEGDSIRKDFIELDGKLYAPVGQRMNIFYLDIIKVIERTESKIKFVYPQFAADSSLYTVEGVLEYENGWKFGWYCIVSLDPWEGDFNFSTAAQGVS